MAGKLADGTTLSLSTTLLRDGGGRVFAGIYTAPPSYQGGYLFGLLEFAIPVPHDGFGVRRVVEVPDRAHVLLEHRQTPVPKVQDLDGKGAVLARLIHHPGSNLIGNSGG